MREFEGGATRNDEEGKLDFEAFLSPRVIQAYGEYMHRQRIQADGKMREGDNWQHGMPLGVYMKSLYRHLIQVWRHHRNVAKAGEQSQQDALCAVLFNASGMLHELLRLQENLEKNT